MARCADNVNKNTTSILGLTGIKLQLKPRKIYIGIHILLQITLAMDKELTYRQDSTPDWLLKSSRQLVICIYRQRTNLHS